MSTSHTRVVKGYLNQSKHDLAVGYAIDKGLSKSEVVQAAVGNFFDNLSSAERLRLIGLAKQKKIGKSKNSY